MKGETDRILQPAGVRLEWRSLNDEASRAESRDLVVMRFRGSCAMNGPVPYSELGPELGGAEPAQTNRVDGHVMPFGDVKCDVIHRYIAPVASKSSDEMLGRAMGRVVAYELYQCLPVRTRTGAKGFLVPRIPAAIW
jgi:hypothetical protein